MRTEYAKGVHLYQLLAIAGYKSAINSFLSYTPPASSWKGWSILDR
jgi:hypothetical protein